MERNHLEDLGIDGIILKWICKKWDGEAWTVLLWLRIGTGGRCLRMWLRSLGFHKMQGVSLAEDLLASKGLCSKELVS